MLMQNITHIGAIRHGDQRASQEFGLVLNQQSSEALVIVFHFHIIIPPPDAELDIVFGFFSDNSILHRQAGPARQPCLSPGASVLPVSHVRWSPGTVPRLSTNTTRSEATDQG